MDWKCMGTSLDEARGRKRSLLLIVSCEAISLYWQRTEGKFVRSSLMSRVRFCFPNCDPGTISHPTSPLSRLTRSKTWQKASLSANSSLRKISRCHFRRNCSSRQSVNHFPQGSWITPTHHHWISEQPNRHNFQNCTDRGIPSKSQRFHGKQDYP